jgi:hypothetical protein
MVNIFIIKPDLLETAKILDDKRLGKQRVEAKQLIDILEELDATGIITKKGWVKHPALKSWIGYTNHLKVYFNIIVREWIRRGFNNTMLLYQIDESPYNVVPCFFNGRTAYYDNSKFNQYSFPFWVSFPPFYMSHQASLCRKNPKHYKGLLRDELFEFLNNGYLWPCNVTNDCYSNWNFSFHEKLATGCPPVYRLSIIDVFRWLKNPFVNPSTGRSITSKSVIYLDYENAMKSHNISIMGYVANIFIGQSPICSITDIDNGVRYLEKYYRDNGGQLLPAQLVHIFANLL